MQQIAEWLKNLGMSEYTERFAENDIDIAVLPDLTDQHLKDLGVSLGHRLKMLRAIRDLGGAPVTVTAPSVPVATQPPQRDEAERRQLTVMFCDLVGSTALSARLDPEDLRGVISTYHRCCTELVERNGGFVAKYMGDGVLAYFGYPQAHEHDAERAVRAGVALVEAVSKLATSAGSPLQVRVGIATGLVVVGDLIGAGAAREQAVVGETPNLAARLQALAEPGAVVIASGTRRLTGGLFDYRDLGTTALKGFPATVPAWQVLGASAVESRFEAMRTAMTPLVGRDEEIDLLLSRWDQAKNGDGEVVLISGEPGIGKSRIAETILERLSNEPHIRLRYFCSPHHPDSALYPSIAQLERAAGFRREDTADQRLDKLEAVLAHGTNDLSEAVPLLADLLSIPTRDRYPPLNLTPQKRKEKTLHAQLTQVEGLATRQPVLMLWEDVHWSDPTTRESLDLLIERIPTLRVLLIITFRPEFTPPWVGRPHVIVVTLSRLPPRQSTDMIARVTGGKTLPKDITDQIVDHADGVPLFIEELTKSVIESGMVTEAADGYAVTGPVAPLAIPTTLHASLLARLDRLAPTREVVQIGAALGRSFSHELIGAVAQMPQRKLDDALEQLVRAELVFRRGIPPNAEYTFKHALVQEAAYGTLLRSRRQDIHGRIATTLQSQFPEVVAAQPELVAQHCGEAGLIESAITFYQRAGEQSVARSAIREAVAHFSKGLDQLSRLPESRDRQHLELDLQSALGNVLFAVKGFAAREPARAYARVQELSDLLGETTHLCRMMFGHWLLQVNAGEIRAGQEIAEELLHLGEKRSEPAGLMMGHLAMAGTLLAVGDFSRSRFHIELLRDLHNPRLESALVQQIGTDACICGWSWLPMDLFLLGYPDQAREESTKVMIAARRRGHAPTAGWCLSAICRFYALLGERALFVSAVDEFTALADAQNFPLWLAQATAYRGWTSLDMVNNKEGIALLEKGVFDYKATGALSWLPFLMSLLADGYRAIGDAASEAGALSEALSLAEQTGELWFTAELHRLKGLVSSAKCADAEREFLSAVDVARRQRSPLWQLRAATSLARLWRDQGKLIEARDFLAPVYGWFTEGFDTPVLQEAKLLLDHLV